MTMWGKTPEEIAAIARKRRTLEDYRDRQDDPALKAIIDATIKHDREMMERYDQNLRRLLWGLVAIVIAGGVLLVVIALSV